MPRCSAQECDATPTWAVWDLTDHDSKWAALLENAVTKVDLHYAPWTESQPGFWCRHITICFSGTSLQIVMGGAVAGVLVPSTDNVAILDSSASLPELAMPSQ
jgi:hypothetical protein